MLCGWLSPDGDFYPCGPYEHIHLAEKLTEVHYPEVRAEQGQGIRDDYLLEEKWIKLFCDGLAVGSFMQVKEQFRAPSDHFITEQQLNWIISSQHLMSARQERCLNMYLEFE